MRSPNDTNKQINRSPYNSLRSENLKNTIEICFPRIFLLNLLCMHNKLQRKIGWQPVMSDDNTIDYYLKAAWQSAANKYNQIASQFGITQATGYVLINIHKEGTPVSQIANLLGIKTTSLSRILNNLEGLGLIYRETNHADKRSVKVYLTALGMEKRELAKDVVRKFNAYLDEHIGSDERQVLVDTLKRINQLAIQYKPE